MYGKLFYKRFRKFLLWALLIIMIYCWNKPQAHTIFVVMYIIFLILNRYYCYLEAQENEKERLGKKFQKDKFFNQYMKENHSLTRMEIMIIVMLLFLLQFHRT